VHSQEDAESTTLLRIMEASVEDRLKGKGKLVRHYLEEDDPKMGGQWQKTPRWAAGGNWSLAAMT
jgi:hypothetical protein